MKPDSLSKVSRKLFHRMEFDQDERLIYEIRKHRFGLFLIYFTGLFVAAVLFVVLVLGALFVEGDPLELGIDFDSMRALVVVAGAVLTLLALAVTAVGAYLYKNNIVLVTNEKIAQILNKDLLHRKISQLSIGDVQDVTVTQVGIFARLFDYGTLFIETAGEQKNYLFTFTPKPYQASKAIVGAHEENLKLHGN